MAEFLHLCNFYIRFGAELLVGLFIKLILGLGFGKRVISEQMAILFEMCIFITIIIAFTQNQIINIDQ
mgnify:CR=1 FL=1|jgi:hypothetical protein